MSVMRSVPSNSSKENRGLSRYEDVGSPVSCSIRAPISTNVLHLGTTTKTGFPPLKARGPFVVSETRQISRLGTTDDDW